jgi:type I restriction enzyme M protein
MYRSQVEQLPLLGMMQGDHVSSVRQNETSGANLGFEDKLWQAADRLRGRIDASQYKHIMLGLVFLKHISDAFQVHRTRIEAEVDGDSDDPSSYISQGMIWVPQEARWSYVRAKSRESDTGVVIDNAMRAVENGNPCLQDALPKGYSQLALDSRRLVELIDLIHAIGLGGEASQSMDILGRVYEYFLGRFASAEGQGSGEFYTPRSVVKLLVEMIEPYAGSVYDPCCGSGGMFVQSDKFVRAHGGSNRDLSIYGQESNPTTWRLCKMNLAIRGIKGDIGTQPADTFHSDLHQELQADFILANPPFNMSHWGARRLRQDVRWRYGVPPARNANFAWIQHIVHHLSPNGTAAIVLTNGSLSGSPNSREGRIRKSMVEHDLVDCIVALPANLFYNTQISACLWFLTGNKGNPRFRQRRGETLFIYCNGFGRMVDRIHRELTGEEIALIADTYHAWRKPEEYHHYKDVPQFCKSVTVEEISSHKWALVPGRYVGLRKDEAQESEITKLRQEIREIEELLEGFGAASGAALDVLRELMDG